MQKKIGTILLLLMIFGSVSLVIRNTQRQDKIRIIFGGGFGGGLYPTNFETVHGAYVSDLVFPPLIGSLDVKQYYPRLVKTWEINSSETILKFTLNPEINFSNGDPLRCDDIKNSLEKTIGIKKKRYNIKVDFKLLNGYKDDSDSIIGIKCPNPMQIEFHSVQANPNLLESLNYPDMGIYKTIKNKYIGCGNYSLEKHGKDYALLKKLERYKPDNFSPNFIEYIGSDTHGTNNADVFVGYAPQFVPEQYKGYKSFEITWMALILHLYRHEQSIFSELANRKALLALLWQDDKSSLLAQNYNKNFILDPQPFLKLQLGRIDDANAKNIISSGSREISNLIENTKKTPLKFVHVGSPNCLKMMEILRQLGLHVDSERSKELSFKDLDFEPADIQCVSFSAALLKKDMIRYSTGDALSPPFEELLSVQQSRNNLTKLELKEHLQKVNRVILGKVPFIKIGRTPVVAYYNQEKIGLRQITHSSHANSLLDKFYLIKSFY